MYTVNGRVRDDADIVHLLEQGEIEEKDIFFDAEEEFTIPHLGTCTGGIQSMTEHIKHHAAQHQSNVHHIIKLKQAYLRFTILSKVGGNTQMDFERYYRELYEDIRMKEHHDAWFNNIFSQHGYGDKAAAMLGTLCTILRQRGDLKGCKEVMPTYMAVINRYKSYAEGCGIIGEMQNYKVIAYKANLIRINLGAQLNDINMAVKAFRDAVAFEKKEKRLGRGDDISDYDDVIGVMIGHNRYDQVSDDMIFKALRFTNGCDGGDDNPQLELRVCACCDKEESMHGDFKRCARCHEMAYCSKKCQTLDWKVHKHLCGKKNTTDIESSVFLDIAKKLSGHYAQVVEINGGTVTEGQKSDAVPGLIKKLKTMLTGEYKYFNSLATICDAKVDPDFSTELAGFFAEQPGYEMWKVLRLGHKEYMEDLNSKRQENKVVMITDDVIKSKCEDIATAYKVHCMNQYEDEDKADLLIQSKHDALVGALVKLAKRYVVENPQYNSYAGFHTMLDNIDFKVQMGLVFVEFA